MIEIRLSHTQWYFDPDRPLGRAGGFGEVYIGRSETGDEVAVKRLKLSAAEAAHRELTIADHLGGKNLEYVIPGF